MTNRLFIKLGEGLYIDLSKARKDLTKLIKKQIIDKNGHVKTVWVKAIENVKVGMRDSVEKMFNNYFAMGFSERIGDIKKTSIISSEVCNNFEKLIDNKPEENCGAFNSEGKLIFTKKGKYDEIEFDKLEIDKIRNAEILTHNHPEDMSLSMKDLFMAISFGVKELKAITPNYICSIKFSHKEKSKNKRETFDKYQYLFNIIDKHNQIEAKKLKTKLENKEITKDKYELILDHNVIKNIIKDELFTLGFNIKYEVKKR